MATNSKFSADLGITTDADLQVDGNVTVSGNLTVSGTQTTVNSSTTSVEDSMLELANANISSDIIDIGIYGNYDDGLGDGVSEYTGFFRDASDSTWKLFDGLESEPTTTVNIGGSGYTLADLQVGDLTATTLTATNALTGSSITYPTSDGTNGQVLKTNGSGVLSFGDSGALSSGTITTTSTSATNLDSIAIASYRGAKYSITISDSTSGVYQITECHVIHDGTNASITQFGTVLQGGSSELGTFTVDINSGNLRLRVASLSTNSTVYKFKRIDHSV
jgi:hypothetical protein|tara:strand:- start:647 stop:1477 length:831 start_codon:yes stop_codon:yes gene_type:complete